ncbi:MAG: DUF2924 domain-containing protein [Alphaproteobacteria bacterium]
MQTVRLTAACTSKGKNRGDRTAGDLEATIRELADLPRPDLTERWRQLYRAEAPKGISRPLLIRAVAYGMQVKRYGGLKPAVRRPLRKVTEGGSDPAAANLKSARIAPGMRLIREWNGSSHVVEAVNGGFVWNGARYGSLSAVARAITGAHWSGPRFFGLESDQAR